MFKSVLLSAVLFTGLTPTVHANQMDDYEATCYPTELLHSVFLVDGMRVIGGGNVMPGPATLMIFINDKTGEWVAIANLTAEDLSCVVASGVDWTFTNQLGTPA